MVEPYDKFFAPMMSDPATRENEVVPSDTEDLPEIPKSIYVGTGGDIAMVGAGWPADTPPRIWRNMPSGSTIPFRPRRVFDTGTTAADMLALF